MSGQGQGHRSFALAARMREYDSTMQRRKNTMRQQENTMQRRAFDMVISLRVFAS